MAMKVQTFKSAPAVAPRTSSRTNLAKYTVKPLKPANLQSEFTAPVASLKDLCTNFAHMALSPLQAFGAAVGRMTLVIEANKKKGLGCTLEGTRRKRARVSGFRTRLRSANGRRVIAARRKRGRKVLCPAGVPKRKV